MPSVIVVDADSLPIVVGDDSSPASMPPLDVGGDDTQVQDTPLMRLTQAALNEARRKLDEADAALDAVRRKRKRGGEGVIDLTK